MKRPMSQESEHSETQTVIGFSQKNKLDFIYLYLLIRLFVFLKYIVIIYKKQI